MPWQECLGGLVERSVTADALIDELDRELDRLAQQCGYPAVLRCDNGPDLACAAMADWAGERVGLSFIPPGEPSRNGYVESFNSRVRDECLNTSIFWSLAPARVVITDWKEDYNNHRRHSALGYQRPPLDTLPPAPTDEQLSQTMDQFSGSGQTRPLWDQPPGRVASQLWSRACRLVGLPRVSEDPGNGDSDDE